MKQKNKAILGHLSDMDIRLLQIFKAVVECGGFSSAELELNISISTISRHIKDLETRLGFTLCQRGRSGFALSTQGQQVYNETLRLLGAINDFRASIDDVHARLGGELHVAVFEKITGNPNSRLPQTVADFTRLAPDVLINLHVRPINEIERGVLDGQYHIGIIPDHRPSNSLRYEPLFHEDMKLYCGESHPLYHKNTASLDWSDIRAFALAGLAYHSPNMEVSHRAKLSRRANAYDQEGVATFILSGKFIGFLPTHYALNFENQGSMRAVNPDRFQYRVEFFAIQPRTKNGSRAVELFHDCLRKAHSTSSVRAIL
ncbi:MAG: LysR family transcriptional regulator [Orrella sp.]